MVRLLVCIDEIIQFALVLVVNEVTARAVRTETHCVEGATEFSLVFRVTSQCAQLMNPVSELTFLPILAATILVERAAQFSLVAAGVHSRVVRRLLLVVREVLMLVRAHNIIVLTVPSSDRLTDTAVQSPVLTSGRGNAGHFHVVRRARVRRHRQAAEIRVAQAVHQGGCTAAHREALGPSRLVEGRLQQHKKTVTPCARYHEGRQERLTTKKKNLNREYTGTNYATAQISGRRRTDSMSTYPITIQNMDKIRLLDCRSHRHAV